MSDNEDEDFVTYGSALEPLDEDNLPRKKAITVEEQFAYDAQGRRRFHGAFTGGFSAGYFNTVGTRDGWRPQQFKSTRHSKASNVVQRPEDFMDEEDTGEFGIAPTAIRATGEYSDQASKGTKRQRARQESTGPIPGTPVLKELLKPVRERVGVMLLKKMGWKPGQGVGPRLTKQEKKQKRKHQAGVKVYGCALPNQVQKSSESESESSEDEFSNITFAPDDYEPYRCNPKDNYFGIGYTGLDRRPILGEHINLFDAPAFSVQDKNKKLSIRGQAFGVGAFEAEDDDIYAREDMSRYDFALGPERKSKSRWSKETKAKSDCIEGFVPTTNQLAQKKVFAAPILPKDFQPVHKVRKSRFSPLDQPGNKKQRRFEMNAESRAKIINDDRPSIINSEEKTEPKNLSVAAKVITKTLNLYGREQVAERKRLEESIPTKAKASWLDKLSSTSFVKGETISTDTKIQDGLQNPDSFMKDKNDSNEEASISDNLVKPSFPDLDKQRRFEQYLKFSISERKLKFASIQPLSMNDWERDREVEEFEKAARLCESIDKAAEKQKEEQKKEKEKESNKIDLESLKSPEEKMTAAAKMKMFGKLTRTEVEWKPAKLVCVRFNIAEPFVGVAEETGKKKKFSIFDGVAWDEVTRFDKGQRLELDCESTPSTSRYPQDTKEESEESRHVTEKEKIFENSYEKVFRAIPEKRDTPENEEEDEPVITKNLEEKKDLFKAIFLSSSEDSESEDESSKEINEKKLKAVLIGKSPAEQNNQRNTSPPRGIFAKLDLDSLMKRPEKNEKSKEPEEEKKKAESEEPKEANNKSSSAAEEEVEIKIEESEMYGPALPASLSTDLPSSSQRPIFTGSSKKNDDSSLWRESRQKKKAKKEKASTSPKKITKKKHKHKERSKSKSRKKSKKDKKRERS